MIHLKVGDFVENTIGEIKTKSEILLPIKVIKYKNVTGCRNLKKKRAMCVSFHRNDMVTFLKAGAFIVLDFGKEICGGVKIISSNANDQAKFHIRMGESLSEAMTPIGTKNAGNDHSPRDFEVLVSNLSDLTFGQSGFRFVYIELCSEQPVLIQSIFAVNTLPDFEFEAKIETNDEELNKIIKIAAYTIKLCCQQGYIWDGIKRDRLVWSGDLHQEILTSFYLFGDIENIRNSIDFIRKDTPDNDWVNWLPTYSAWWVINLCDYCSKSGNLKFFRKNKVFADEILLKINSCIDSDGNINIGDQDAYFLDWQTYGTNEAVIGTIAIFIMAAKRFLLFEENADARAIILKLMPVLQKAEPKLKQAQAFKYLAGGYGEKDISKELEKDGASGLSTFMAYYILTADALSGGENMLSLIKEYFGGMINCGATTFWEDFDVDWLKNSGRIDTLPLKDEKDIHGDFGNFCYKNFRHSLCHGWSSGLISFIVEQIIGLKIEKGKVVSITPNLYGLKHISAEIPVGKDMLFLKIFEDKIETDYKRIIK